MKTTVITLMIITTALFFSYLNEGKSDVQNQKIVKNKVSLKFKEANKNLKRLVGKTNNLNRYKIKSIEF